MNEELRDSLERHKIHLRAVEMMRQDSDLLMVEAIHMAKIELANPGAYGPDHCPYCYARAGLDCTCSDHPKETE